MLDENEFLSPYGIRALSRYHKDHPYVVHVNGQEYRVNYLPAESDTGMFGGNSNWRGPIWMPVNALLIRALLSFYRYYGDSFKIECPTGSGNLMNLFEVAREISNRLTESFCAMSPAGGRCTAGPRSSRLTLSGRTTSCSSSTSTATMAPALGPATRRMDWPGGKTDRDVRPRRRKAASGGRQSRSLRQGTYRRCRSCGALTN